MKYALLIIISFFSLACHSQQWIFAQGINTGNSYGVPEGQELAEQCRKYWRQQGQTDYADSIHFAIEACVLQGKFKKPAKATPLCTAFNRKHFPGLYTYVGYEAIDKKKNSVN